LPRSREARAANAKIGPDDVDVVIVATTTPDETFLDGHQDSGALGMTAARPSTFRLSVPPICA
jgi:3-oxoacyl-[acyl-carrier-protein] synthase III